MSDESDPSPGGGEDKIERVVAQLEVLIGKYRADQEKSPESVKELVAGVWKDLLAIASKPTKLVRKAFEVAQSALGAAGHFMAGTGTLPDATAQWIRGNRALADAREDQKQAAIEQPQMSTLALPGSNSSGGAQLIASRDPIVARASLTQWMQRVRAGGDYANLFEIRGYGFLLVFGPIDAVPQLLESGIRALRTVKALPAPPALPALPMPREEDDENSFPGLAQSCAVALKAANLGRLQVMKMTDAQIREIVGIGKKRAAIVRKWIGTTA
jgi:hypothetical protein